MATSRIGRYVERTRQVCYYRQHTLTHYIIISRVAALSSKAAIGTGRVPVRSVCRSVCPSVRGNERVFWKING